MMSVVSGAEVTLYRSRRHYRTSAARASAREDCFAACMRDCDADAFTCRRECEQICRPSLPFPPCPPGEQPCLGMRPRRCCADAARCCSWNEWPSLRERVSCCADGQACCHRGGCYDPQFQQCSDSGVVNCPTGVQPCHGRCCGPGEACTRAGCTPAELACLGQRCDPGEVCTTQGCCAPDRVTPHGCCPRDRTLCDGKCCAPGEICRTTTVGGFCIRPL